MKKLIFTLFFFAASYVFSYAFAFAAPASATKTSQARTQQNTITVINTDEIQIVTNAHGQHGFRLKNLDVLWGTRAASCALVAIILIAVVFFIPAADKQTINVLAFINGCALTLSFYPLGIAFMIYEWNKTYGLASAAVGAVLFIISIMAFLKLRAKTNVKKETPVFVNASVSPEQEKAQGYQPAFGSSFNGNEMPDIFPNIYPGDKSDATPPPNKKS